MFEHFQHYLYKKYNILKLTGHINSETLLKYFKNLT